MAARLTIKQEAFVLAYIETGNASEAYRQAYNTSRMKPESINRLAFALLGNIKITSRVSALQEEHRKRHNVTVDSLAKQAQEIYSGAMGAQQYSAAKGAVELTAKLLGLLPDRREITGADKGPLVVNSAEELTDEQLIAIIQSAGIDPEIIKP